MTKLRELATQEALAHGYECDDRDRQRAIDLAVMVGEMIEKDWKAYTDLLVAELQEVVGMAAMHGWKSSRYEEGKRLRAALGIGDE